MLMLASLATEACLGKAEDSYIHYAQIINPEIFMLHFLHHSRLNNLR